MGLTDEYETDPNQPLFILDGFETTLQTISDLSMDRVQSITILKDVRLRLFMVLKRLMGGGG